MSDSTIIETLGVPQINAESKMSQLHCCKLAISENAAERHMREVVSHANKESLSGNSSAIFETMHTCITLCNQSVPGTKQYENNEPNVTLPAKRCRSVRKMTMALGSFLIRATDMLCAAILVILYY